MPTPPETPRPAGDPAIDIELCMFLTLRPGANRHIRFCGRLAASLQASEHGEAIVFPGRISGTTLILEENESNSAALITLGSSLSHGLNWTSSVQRAAAAYYRQRQITAVTILPLTRSSTPKATP
jgi:hypothetical protein